MSYYENIRGICNRNRFDLRMATNFICVYGLSTIDAFVRNICSFISVATEVKDGICDIKSVQRWSALFLAVEGRQLTENEYENEIYM